MFFQDFTYDFGRKAATLKESGLTCPFSRVRRCGGELSAGDVAGTFEFAVAAVFFNGRDDLLGADAAAGQFETQARGAEAGRLGPYVGIGKAYVGEQSKLGESIEFGVDFFFAAELAQFVGQLGAGVLALREAA